MKLTDFKTELQNALNCQVFISHTTTRTKVQTPYIVIVEVASSNVFSDNRVSVNKMNLAINVHSYDDEKEIIENKIEKYFFEHCITWEKDVDWLDDIMLFKTQYDIQLIYG